MKAKILYEDKEILIVNKPVGLAVQTAKVGQPDLVSELKNYLKAPYLGVVHRLDQPVEGLLVFAKTRRAAAELTKQLGQGILYKQYYAVICGKPAAQSGTLVDYLIKDSTAGMAKVVGKDFREARKAILQYRVLTEIDTPERLALMDIQIETGRFHQIRAQMSHADMPLLGDGRYGNKDSLDTASRLGVRNAALCACLLEIKHPTTGKKLSWKIVPEGKAFTYFAASQKW